MNIEESYRLLGLTVDATLEEVKKSYRLLARKYHPDVNPQDLRSHDKFIEINQAYNFLLGIAKPPGEKLDEVRSASASSSTKTPPQTRVTAKKSNTRQDFELTDPEKLLKQKAYLELQGFLQNKRFARAVVLTEALIQRIPQDPDVKEWLASAYQRLASQLITEKKLEQARIYLKKALRTDPHNRSLWVEVERDFRRLEQMIRASKL
ncbi:molecular chaperone DnaJ [Planktothricoides sp. SR001]|uniref:J domain-containing protein n=1 Tax=Planktothricoides sp. SR001 TaxID=1705388 RepID=UPI0006C285A0|nr:DnaJ domain-containing protein [Planktothricoides sp. SR001]KOR34557.1 molecular chaperone DnaJ [Planktothricoides sp. SR001]